MYRNGRLSLTWWSSHHSRHALLHFEVGLYFSDSATFLVIDLVQAVQDRCLLIDIRCNVFNFLAELSQIVRLSFVLFQHALDAVMDGSVFTSH